ncbi:hypothetical protein BH23CHL8_BH23CHL8_03140 [soil metagenome]
MERLVFRSRSPRVQRGEVMSTTRASIAAAALAMALSLPALGADDASERARPAALEGSSLAWCGDIQPIRAAPEAYRDTPVYVGNEQPVEEIMEWAREQLGYEGLWIDRENFGWLTLAFSKDADARQTDLLERFPDAGVVAVAVDNTAADLRRLHRRAVRELRGSLESFGVSDDVQRNVVEIGVPYLTADVVADLERRFAGEPICVDGGDPADRPVPGPQPTEGDGWRLVGHRQGGGEVYRTGIATDERAYRRLWRLAEMRGRPPAVDLTDHVVLWFAEPHGSSCPERRLDDVVVDRETRRVYPLLVDPEANLGCTDDIAGSWQFLVALERSRLPAGPFMLQLGPGDPPAGAPRERTVVDIDLSRAGVVAGKDDVHFDPTIGQPKPARSGMVLEGFQPEDYAFDVRCGIAYLGEINGIHWVSDRVDVPAAWQGSVGPDGELVVSIDIIEGTDAHIEASLNGETVRYDATREAPAVCAPQDAASTYPVTLGPAEEAARVPTPVQALECDFKGRPHSVHDEWGYLGGYESPDEALRTVVREGFVIPVRGYHVLAADESTFLYGYRNRGEVKVAIRVTSPAGDGERWIPEWLADCRLSEYGRKADMGRGVWLWANSRDRTVQERRGPAHCDWQSIRFLYWSRPDAPRTVRATSLYLRDPEGRFRGDWEVPFLRSTTLPSDARNTGYRRDGAALWMAADARAMYVKDGARVERWPRVPSGIGCA